MRSRRKRNLTRPFACSDVSQKTSVFQIDTAFDKLEIGMEVRPRYREKLEQVPDFWETVHRMANMKSIILYNTKKNGMPYPSIKTVIHFVETFGCDPQTTLDILKIPASEQPRYLEKIYWR